MLVVGVEVVTGCSGELKAEEMREKGPSACSTDCGVRLATRHTRVVPKEDADIVGTCMNKV